MRFQTIFLISVLLLLSFVVTASGVAQTDDGSQVQDKPKKREKTKDILSKNTDAEREFSLRKQQFVDSAVSSLTDTTRSGSLFFELAKEQRLPFVLDSKGLQGLHLGPPDAIGDELRRRQADVPPTIPLNQAIQSLVRNLRKSKPKPADSNLPVPTDMEVDILKVLWVDGSATASEIYAKLDTNTVIFSEELQEVLKKMVDRGFLDRKQLSPANEFGLFGLAKIELSSKNRKNKVFLYWPIVTRQKLFTYLDAQRYMALVSAQNDQDYDIKNNRYASNYQKYLEKKLYRMFE